MKLGIGFIFAGIFVVAALCLTFLAHDRQPDLSPRASAPASQDEAAKAASRAMTFTQPKEPER